MRATKYLILPFVCAIILCVCSISYFTYQGGKEIIIRTTEKHYHFVLLEVARNIDQRVKKVLEAALIASHSSTVKGSLEKGLTPAEMEQRRVAVRASLATINRINTESTSLALLNTQGEIVVDSEGILTALLPAIGMGPRSGGGSVPTEAADSPVEAADLPAEAADSPVDKLREGKPYVGVQTHPVTKSVIIYGLAPVFTSGSYAGAVFFSMNMDTFGEVWGLPLESLPEVRMTLLDAQKNVIICSDDYFSAGMNYLQKYDTDTLFNSMGELVTLRANGLRVGMRWSVPVFNGSITIGVEKDVLFAPAMALLRKIFLIATLAGVLAILCTVLIFVSTRRRLRKNDDTLTQMLDAAGIATWEWDSKKSVMRVNRFFGRMLGYDEEQTEYSQAWCAVHMHPADRQKYINGSMDSAEHNAHSQECRFKNARGEWQWLRLFGAISLDTKSGNIVSGKGIFVDIHARKEVEAARELQQQRLEVLVDERTAALRESNSTILRERALLDSVLNSIPDLIYYKDTAGRYVGCNEACARLFGFAVEDIIGKTDGELRVFNQTTLQGVEERDKQAYAIIGPYWYEQLVEFSDGRAIIYETVKKVFYNEYGTVQGLVGISRNTTERKKAEEELMQARQDASAANQAKSDFLANMSHEIRTPLNGIVGLNYLAMQEEPSPKVLDYLKKIATSAQNLSLIINDILDFSKIEAGKLELDYSAFSLHDIVQSVFDLLQPMADKKGISLLVEYQGLLPPAVLGDSLRLSQVFVNLLSNAIKFTHEGSVSLLCTVQKQTEKRISLAIRVQDTGIGMSEEQLSRLFTAFTQADASTTRQYGGTGLGLTICKSIVGLMGGNIRVSSVPNEGSCFSFTLDFDIATSTDSVPLDAEGANVPSVAEGAGPAAAVAGEAGRALQGTRVLLAEDNDINQIIAQELLQAIGCTVDIASDGQEAVTKALNASYDIILMDIQMPVMDGFSATRELRKHAGLNSIPIIAMTAHAMMGDREKSLAVGMQDHITKPIDPTILEQMVYRWVKGQAQG